ncbi:MAG: hypothetical protein ACK5Y6_10095 [Pseudomonadota bacterium]|jgi:hypothetical protein
MKRLFSGFAVILSLSAASVCAQTGYVVNETELGSDQEIAAVNEAGWYVVEVRTSSDPGFVLKGPGGYSRDITALAPSRSADGTLGSAFIAGVDKDGAVYFQQNTFNQEKDGKSQSLVITGNVVKKLPRDANAVSDFYSYTDDHANSLGGYFKLNSSGQILHHESLKSSAQHEAILTRFENGRESKQNISFPAMARGHQSRQFLDFDNSGNFALARMGQKRLKPTSRDGRDPRPVFMTGLCTGSFASQALSCMEPSAIEKLNKQGYLFEGMAGGSVVLIRVRRRSLRVQYLRLDPKTFKATSSLLLPPAGMFSEPGFNASGDIAALLISPLDERRKVALIEQTAAGVERKLRCAFKRKVAIYPSFVNPLQPLSTGGFLVVGRRGDTGVLLEFTPASVSAIPADAAGECLPR